MVRRRQRHSIFISYRRDDTAGHARALYRELERRFRGRVFMDLDLEPGVDFVETLGETLKSCKVLLALIGRQWLTLAGGDGRRRLDIADDFVRTELETALKGNVKVIPVLVDHARAPEKKQLPPELEALARRHAIELSDLHWDADVERLIRAIRRALAEDGGVFKTLLRSKLMKYLAAALAVLLTLIGPNTLLAWLWTRWVTLYYYDGGALIYIVTRTDVSVTLAGWQALSVSAYSCFWMAFIYPRLRRWLHRPAAPPDAGKDGEPEARRKEGKPRLEEDEPKRDEDEEQDRPRK